VTGPRQSGKTTLVRRLFEHLPYASLEEPDVRRLAVEDPRRFLASYPGGAVLDEVQRAPEILSYLQARVDEDRRPGRFVLTGSQQFGLLDHISQTLAGRIALVPLLPFSYTELAAAGRAPGRLEDLLFQGLYPPIHDRGLEPGTWYGNYVSTYVERDVRQMINVRELSAFNRFVRMCAARCGQILNLSGLAADCGITHNTARAWLSVLEASYLVHLLPAHHRNFSKRLMKSPKLYFLDSGLAAWLLGIQSPDALFTHAMRGALFESWVVSELLKGRHLQAPGSNLHFWRDRSGLEIDVLIDQGEMLVPVEAKSGQTVASDFTTGIRRWSALAGVAAARGWVVYGGDAAVPRDEAEVLPWKQIARLVNELNPTPQR
jgi:predicted AAA+ superfamily ATPase